MSRRSGSSPGCLKTGSTLIVTQSPPLTLSSLIGLIVMAVRMVRWLGREVTRLRMTQLVGQTEFSLSVTHGEI